MSKANQHKHKILSVRELFKFSTSEIRDNLKTNLTIRFEDNIDIPLSYKEIILLRYILEVYKVIPNVPIVSKHLFTNYYSNKTLTSKTINSSFESIFEDAVNIYVKPSNNRAILAPMFKEMFHIVNVIYNDLVYSVVDYGNSINVQELLDVQMDPKLIKAMQDVAEQNTTVAVNKTYEILDDILSNKPELKDNIISKNYLARTINPHQVNQMLASRGYTTDISSSIYKKPIATSFTLGMADIYDLAIESRSGAKALHLSNQAVSDTEYFARELQLTVMLIEKLVDGDCGNNEYIGWHVRPANGGIKSDLENIIGKYYYNPETKREEVIKITDKHLIGTTIQLRTSINCKLPDSRCVCTRCFGELAYSVPLHANIGHYSTTEVTQKLTQSILSTKHLAASADNNEIKLDETSSKFFIVKSNIYHFKPNILNKVKTKFKLLVEQKEAFGIKDLHPDTDVTKLNLSRVSTITNVILVQETNGVEESFPIMIKDQNKRGSFSYEFLSYIINRGYALDNSDRYIIELDGWDNKRPFIVMPELEYNYVALTKNIKTLLSSMKKNGSSTPESMLQDFFNLVNAKLSVNLALLEIIIYGFTVSNPDERDYSLGRNSNNRKLETGKSLISYRSLGAGYGWEDVSEKIISPRSYYGNNATSHPMDIVIKPNEAIMDHYGTLKIDYKRNKG